MTRVWGILVAVAVAVAFCVGLYLGASVSQPMLLHQPARDVLTQADQIDHVLLDGLQDPRSIAEDMRKLRARIAALPKGQGKDIAFDLDLITAKLADQNTSFQTKLWQAHEGIAKAREQLELQAEAADGIPATLYDQLRRFLKWTGPIILIAIVGLIILMFVPGARAWFQHVREIAFGPLALKRDVASVRTGIAQRLNEINEAVSTTYQDKSTKFDLEGLFSRLKSEIDKKLKAEFGVEMANVPHRATLYVPGMTDEQLVQATKYLPPAQQDPNRKVVGRRFSVRYGIIGRAFRQRTALYNWKVDNTRNELVRDWGLTRAEAFKQGGHATSLMALPIPPDENGDPLGIVYLQADGENLLMPNKAISDLRKEITNDPNGRVEADRLAHEQIWKPLWDGQLVQPLYETLQAMKADLNWDTPLQGQDGQ